jgi:hypothetical protein
VDTKNATTEAKTTKRLNGIIKSYKKLSGTLEQELEAAKENTNPEKLKLHRISGFYAFALLYQRALYNVVRDRSLFVARIITSLLLGVLLGLLGYDLGDDQDGAMDRYGVLSIMLAVTPFMTILAAIVNCKLACYSNQLTPFI